MSRFLRLILAAVVLLSASLVGCLASAGQIARGDVVSLDESGRFWHDTFVPVRPLPVAAGD